MDFIAVVSVNLFLRRHRKYRYLILAAGLSSVVGLILLLLIKKYMLYCLVVHLILNTGMVVLAFGRCRKREFIENWIVTYLVVILLGGLMEWLNRIPFFSRNFFLSAIAGALGVYALLLYLMQKRDFSNHIFTVTIIKEMRRMEVKGYWDSGNQLRDPYTGQGISILSYGKAKEFFVEGRDRMRLVPYRSLGEKDGLLWVTDVDELKVLDGKSGRNMQHMAIGIASEGLLEDKEYDLILHASLL